MTAQNLLVELFVEELPPKALVKLGKAFASAIVASLAEQSLIDLNTFGRETYFASPRRLAVWIPNVLGIADSESVSQKLMPATVGWDAEGKPTAALLKKLAAVGCDASAVSSVYPINEGNTRILYVDRNIPGATLAEGLQKALAESIAKLPIPKVMTYQLESGCALPGWSSVSFVRPAHGLVALHGADVVPVEALGLKAGNTTHGHRFEAAVDPVVFKDADSYAATLAKDGAVIASFAERKAEIARQLAAAAAKVGGDVRPIDDDALLDEVTALVERPNVLVCEFEKQFLDVPQECLILTMKANQKYFPLLDTAGKLTNQFLVVSNISPADASAVVGGNERVVRPRLADAKFFFDQDRKKTLESRVAGLDKVVYHNKLGTQGERTERVRAIAKAIGQQLGGDVLAQAAETAARLAKTDLLTDMVGEFPELQGIMGGYYARHDGLSEEIALAIEDHYKPRFAGDELPRNHVGVVVALADKLETLVGMFGIGNVPSGDRDPFALRRHALGVVRMLNERRLHVGIAEIVGIAYRELHTWMNPQQSSTSGLLDLDVVGKQTHVRNFVSDVDRILFNARVESEISRAHIGHGLLCDFIYDRLAGSLRDQGYSAQEVDAVIAQRPQRLGEVPKRLAAVRAFAALPESPALAAANKRIGNILKKAPEVDAHVNKQLLSEPAEVALHQAMEFVLPMANSQFDAGDYTASLQTLAALRVPVDAFFDGVMVNADEMDLRLNRQGLLKMLHDAMNRVADLSRLAA